MTKDYSNRITGYELVPANQLQAHPDNARRHPARQREALRGSLDTLGFIAPVIINKTTGYCIDGHARIEEALTANDEQLLPVIYVELAPHEEAQALASYDFITSLAEYDKDNLSSLFAQVETDDQRVMDTMTALAEETQVFIPDDFPEYTEEIADTVEYHTCPNCDHEFPK